MGEVCPCMEILQRLDGFFIDTLEFRWYGQFWVAILDDIETNMLFWEDSRNVLKSRFLLLGLDRVIAPAENQCFVFSNIGIEDWNDGFDDPSSARPPFPALGDLNGDDNADLLVGTRDGYINAFYADGNEFQTLGFPYTLPSEVCGGFVIADIDNDEKVEVVFGTMDNYLHVWELGSCDEGYAPWPQIQHDVERTGALE